MTSLDEELVRDALSQVMDPEAGMNIVDLGLVYSIDAGEHGVHVRMTMTSAACPMADLIVDDACAALQAVLPGDIPVDVEMVWDPPWTPDRMSTHARANISAGRLAAASRHRAPHRAPARADTLHRSVPAVGAGADRFHRQHGRRDPARLARGSPHARHRGRAMSRGLCLLASAGSG